MTVQSQAKTQLVVPFIQQKHPNACGAAAFQMVLGYYKPEQFDGFSQPEMFERLKKEAPHNPREFDIAIDHIIAEARRYDLCAGWGRVSTDLNELQGQVDYFIRKCIPLIACQRFTDRQPQTGHFSCHCRR
jgi:Peptidase_C39 like family